MFAENNRGQSTPKQLNEQKAKRVKSKLLLLAFAIFFWIQANAQKTEISGKITEKETGNPIPYASVVFPGTYIGTMSDINGNFNFSTTKPTGTIEVSAIGFIKQAFPVKINQTNVF